MNFREGFRLARIAVKRGYDNGLYRDCPRFT